MPKYETYVILRQHHDVNKSCCKSYKSAYQPSPYLTNHQTHTSMCLRDPDTNVLRSCHPGVIMEAGHVTCITMGTVSMGGHIPLSPIKGRDVRIISHSPVSSSPSLHPWQPYLWRWVSLTTVMRWSPRLTVTLTMLMSSLRFP